MKLIKLDPRYRGYPDFKWTVAIHSVPVFLDVREWCWATFGAGCEVELKVVRPGQTWAWRYADKPRPRTNLYFKSDAEAALFKLKWS